MCLANVETGEVTKKRTYVHDIISIHILFPLLIVLFIRHLDLEVECQVHPCLG